MTLPLVIARRGLLAVAGGFALVRPAAATPREVEQEIAKIAGGTPLQPGRVKLDLSQMVENGNAVSVVVSAQPEAGQTVRSLHLFAQGNPNPEVFHAAFGPAAFEPKLSTRMRLATSQTVVAVAAMDDGTFWTDSVSVIVTLAACLE